MLENRAAWAIDPSSRDICIGFQEVIQESPVDAECNLL